MGGAHRIALISDIHGNEIALAAVLRAIEQRGTDEVVCLGDVATLGPRPVEVVGMLQQLGCACIAGNHDDYILDPTSVDSHAEGPLIAEAIDWCRESLPREQIDFMRTFEEGLSRPLGANGTLTLFHGSPSSNRVNLLSETPIDAFDEQLGRARSDVMAGGHTHLQMLRQHRGSLVVNPGSVGAAFRELPTEGPPDILDHAEYATVEARAGEISVTLHRVALDKRALARAALDSKNPMREALARPYL